MEKEDQNGYKRQKQKVVGNRTIMGMNEVRDSRYARSLLVCCAPLLGVTAKSPSPAWGTPASHRKGRLPCNLIYLLTLLTNYLLISVKPTRPVQAKNPSNRLCSEHIQGFRQSAGSAWTAHQTPARIVRQDNLIRAGIIGIVHMYLGIGNRNQQDHIRLQGGVEVLE